MRTIKQRRRKGKTDYNARIKLLKSGIPRIVIRKTNQYILAQYIESEEAKDKVIIGVSSKDLLKYGWPKENQGSLKSIPAAYLTGLLLAKRIKGKGKVILDLGIMRNIKKSRIYGALKGLVDGEVEISYKDEVFPPENRIKGEHLKNKINFEDIKNKILK